MRPIDKKNYNSINHLLGSKLGEADRYINQGQHSLLTQKKHGGIVYVAEKYDGANAAIANVGNHIIPLTKAGFNAFESKYLHHLQFAKWCDCNKSKLSSIIPNNTRLCVEILSKVHTLSYDYFEPQIVAFDLIGNETNKRLGYLDFLNMDTWVIPKVRMIYIGSPIAPQKLIATLNENHNHLVRCKDKPEGMVYRLEKHNEFRFAAKWVRSDFLPGKFL